MSRLELVPGMGHQKAIERAKMAGSAAIVKQQSLASCKRARLWASDAGQPRSAEGAQYMQPWEASPSTGGGEAV